MVAWVDGVGAFLLCLDETTTLGGLSGQSDVRIAANLAGLHAKLQRSGEGYLIEAIDPTVVAGGASGKVAGRGSGRVVEARTDLNNGDEIVLFRENSEGVRLRFSHPNALTSTAVLTIESDHRSQPRYDGTILLAEACLLGPGADAHIRNRQAEGTVTLFRRDDDLWCRSDRALSVGGRAAAGPFRVRSGDFVEGPGISFRLEAL